MHVHILSQYVYIVYIEQALACTLHFPLCNFIHLSFKRHFAIILSVFHCWYSTSTVYYSSLRIHVAYIACSEQRALAA